jgi:hypothetical protein
MRGSGLKEFQIMKPVLHIGDFWRCIAAALVACVGLWVGALALAQDSGGAVPPGPIQIPPGPPPGGGQSIAGSSRFIVIGRPADTLEGGDTNLISPGRVLVWELDESYLVDDVARKRFWLIDPPAPRSGDHFGGAVAAGDRWIAVAHGISRVGGGGVPSGHQNRPRVQLIEFPPDGGWLPGPVLPDGADAAVYARNNFQFGISMAMQGNRLVVGSILGALVYEVSSTGVWTRTQILGTNYNIVSRPDNAAWGTLGQVVAMRGDLIVLGAPNAPGVSTNGLQPGQGRALVYRRGAGGLYTEERELRAINGSTNDAFGTSIAVEVRNGVEWIAVGAPNRTAQLGNGRQPRAGSVHLFRRTLPDGAWVFHREFTNTFSNGRLTQQARSGTTIAMSGGRLAVGAVASGGVQFPSANGEVAFFRYNDEQEEWFRSGEVAGGSTQFGGGDRFGSALHGFEHGILIGIPGSRTGRNWEWRPTDPYVGLINQATGPFVAGTPAEDRRLDADPDGDGFLNADELLFGTPPLVANTNSVFTAIRDGVSNVFRLRWQQLGETFGLATRVEWSGEMSAAGWSTNGLQVVNVGAVPESNLRRYEARVPIGGRTNVFFRINVR